MGLKANDLLLEETPIMQEALRRLPPDVALARAQRIKVASQCSLQHVLLPKEHWIKPEEDDAYLEPIINQVTKEFKEREDFDNLKV